MSSVFRAILVTGRSRWCVSSSSFLKFNFNLAAPRSSHCRCKALLTLPSTCRRDYSTSADTKVAATDTKVPEKEIVYTGFLTKNIRSIKLFSLTTSLVGLCVQPMVYTKAITEGSSTAWTLPAFAIVGLFALATPPLLHMVTKKYVIDIVHDPKTDKYTATYFNLFAMKRKIEFTPDDVTVPDILGMFTTCAIKGKPFFIDAKSFPDQSHYIRIMGYDKPLDLNVKNIHLQEAESKKDND